MPFGNGVNWSGESAEIARAGETLDFVVTWSDDVTNCVPVIIHEKMSGTDAARALIAAWNREATPPGSVAVHFIDRFVYGGTVMFFDRGERNVQRVELVFPDSRTVEVPSYGGGPLGPLGYGESVDVYGLNLRRVRPAVLHPA